MIRTTAIAAFLALAAIPAAAQSMWGASVTTPAAETAATAPEGTEVTFRGPETGLPALALTGPATAGTLASGPLAAEVPPAAPPLNHLDFGAYEPYDPKTSREVLKDIARSRTTSPKASDGINDVSINIAGTAGETTIGTSYATTTGPVNVQAKASVVVPGVASRPASSAFVQAPAARVGVNYKF